MQLNRVLGRVRLARPRRMPLVVMLAPRTQHIRCFVNTRQTTNNSNFPSSRIESKMERTFGEKGSSSSAFDTSRSGSDSGSSTSSSSSSTGSGYASDNRGGSSSYPESSGNSSGSGYNSGTGSWKSSETSSSSGPASLADRSASRSAQAPAFGRTPSSPFPSSSSSSSNSPSASSSSSSEYLGSKTADDRNSNNDSGFYGAGKSKQSDVGRGEEGESWSEKASKMADKVSDKFAGSESGSFGETASKMADKVSDKLSGGGKNDQQKYSRENKYSGDTNRSYSETSRPASDYGRSDYGSDSSSGTGASFGETVNKMSSKVSDKISEGSSAIGQTLHKISDKISETFSGSGQSEGNRSRGSSYSSGDNSVSSRRNSSISPFDLSGFFRNNFFGDWGQTFSGQALSMKTDIIEHDSEYRVICDLPGVDKKDISISLRKNYLEIYGERSEGYNQQDADHTVHCQERYFGNFTRRLTLPNDASKDMSGIKAKCENGVLTVTIPKSQDSPSSSRNRYNINIE